MSNHAPAANQRYAAFICYSHQDELFAVWLHRALESYRLPKDLLAQSARGEDRIAPVFRDEEELPAASDLTKEIQDALSASKALVVVCSPASAASPWVEREIQFFLSLGRADQVFAIIVAGEPHAQDPRRECLPSALRQTNREVFAPDARVKGRQRRIAVLKLIGGLHALALGQLVQRDALRRRIRRLQIVSLAAVALAIASGLTTAWFVEYRRAAAERQNRLLAQTRAAFEDDHPEQGIATLAAAWPGLSAAERARYGLVVDAWVPAFPDIRTTLATLKSNSVFRSSDRLFFFDGRSVATLPYATNVLTAVNPQSRTAYGISPSGQVMEWGPGFGSPRVLAEDQTSWSRVLWKEAVVVRAGIVLFSGELDADRFSEQLPVLLVVAPSTKRWYFINILDDYFGPNPSAGLFLSRDCSHLAWVASLEAVPVGFGVSYNQPLTHATSAIYRLKLDDPIGNVERVESTEPGDFAAVRPEHGVDFLSNFVGRCSDGAVSSLREGRTPDLTLPSPSVPSTDLVEKDRDVVNDVSTPARRDRAAQRASFVDLADRIQRGQFGLASSQVNTPGRDSGRDSIAGRFPGWSMSVAPGQGFEVIEYSVADRTPGGYDQTATEFICVARTGTLAPRCTELTFHRMIGSPRIYSSFVYVPGGRVPDDPLFVLVSLPDLTSVEFRDGTLAGELGVDGAATALSPSSRQFVLVSQGQIHLFDLSADLEASPRARFDVPALVGGSTRAETGAEYATPAFVGETSLAIARPDGLVVLMDLTTYQEIWRFRIPSVSTDMTRASSIRVHLEVSTDASLLAARGDHFAAILDARSGLPLTRPVRSGFHGQVGPPNERNSDACRDAFFVGHCFALPSGKTAGISPLIVSSDCVRRSPLQRCFDRVELTEIFDRRNGAMTNWLKTASDGTLIAEVIADDWRVVMHPIRRQTPLEQESLLPTIRCRSGWTVDQMRLSRFDAFASVDAGQPVALDLIAATCAS